MWQQLAIPKLLTFGMKTFYLVRIFGALKYENIIPKRAPKTSDIGNFISQGTKP